MRLYIKVVITVNHYFCFIHNKARLRVLINVDIHEVNEAMDVS